MDEPHAKRRGWLKNDNPTGDPSRALRCGAKAKRTQKSCMAPAMANGRSRMHGGKSTGPRTLEGLECSRAANWKTGQYSKDAIAERKIISESLRNFRDLLKQIKEASEL